MTNTYFNMIGQKSGGGKLILVAVVEDTLLGANIPDIFQVQSFMMAQTIYTGYYPQIKVNTDSIEDRSDLLGLGINGIITTANWYCQSIKKQDLLGISIEKK